MKSSAYSKILCFAGVAVICACIIFEAAALLSDRGTYVPAAVTDQGAVYSVSAEDEVLIARLVYGAAKDEPFICKVAVAAVILNRLGDVRYPDSVRGVIENDLTFAEYVDSCGEDADPEELLSAKNAVSHALRGQDPSNGALNFCRAQDDVPSDGSALFRASRMIFTDR